MLVVEDDPRLRDVLLRGLEAEGLAADAVPDGARALSAVSEVEYDAVILDVGLPDMDGNAVCAQLRARGVRLPVLMLTARDGIADRVAGLDAGADDYLAKPFALEELLARLRALWRRDPAVRPTVLEVGALRLNPATHEAWRGDVALDLTLREFGLLEVLMRHPGQVLSRDQLLEHGWPAGTDQRSNVIEVYVRYLREKIDRPFDVASIENVRGLGYRLRRDGGC